MTLVTLFLLYSSSFLPARGMDCAPPRGCALALARGPITHDRGAVLSPGDPAEQGECDDEASTDDEMVSSLHSGPALPRRRQDDPPAHPRPTHGVVPSSVRSPSLRC
jgi:hypothetical protein